METTEHATATKTTSPKKDAQELSTWQVDGQGQLQVSQERPRSHTQDNPITAPHTKATLSMPSAPEPYIRLFLLAWAVRYIPRGLLGEAFDARAPEWLKKPLNKMIDSAVINRKAKKINEILSHEIALIDKVRKNEALLDKNAEAGHLFDKLKPIIHEWRGDASTIIPNLVAKSTTENGAVQISRKSHRELRDMVRARLDDMLYSLSLFVGSTALTLNYSKQVKTDITNLFRETVAMEKGIGEDKVSFRDIAQSDNKIVRHTIENYRSKRGWRLASDSLFLFVATPLKSIHITDALLGVKGWQMFRDTRRRNPTMFEDLITFVHNKINPINGLGQPISIGEVFDLYQHYAQAYAPDHAFVGVIEHAKSEGARWAENQVIFQRMTELLNNTYAYKHQSIVDARSGLTVLQADFALPKFIYLLGHDLIDVNHPQQTLLTIEIANQYGIPAVKQMGEMLKSGQPLEAVVKRYPVTMKTPAPQVVDTTNGVIPKNVTMQMDAAPGVKIDAQSVQASNSLTPHAGVTV